MIFTGELIQDTNLQSKALRDVNQFLKVLETKKLSKLYKIAQLSWKRKNFWKRKHKKSDIVLPIFNFYELQEINIISRAMIDAKILFGSTNEKEIRTIRFVAEKKRYKTHPDAMFRFNPISLLRAESFKTS